MSPSTCSKCSKNDLLCFCELVSPVLIPSDAFAITQTPTKKTKNIIASPTFVPGCFCFRCEYARERDDDDDLAEDEACADEDDEDECEDEAGADEDECEDDDDDSIWVVSIPRPPPEVYPEVIVTSLCY